MCKKYGAIDSVCSPLATEETAFAFAFELTAGRWMSGSVSRTSRFGQLSSGEQSTSDPAVLRLTSSIEYAVTEGVLVSPVDGEGGVSAIAG